MHGNGQFVKTQKTKVPQLTGQGKPVKVGFQGVKREKVKNFERFDKREFYLN